MPIKPEVSLLPHQERGGKKAVENKGTLLLGWHAGAGKSLGALKAEEDLHNAGRSNRTLIITPAALRKNFTQQGIERFTDDPYTAYGNQEEVRRGTHASIDDPIPGTRHHVVSYELFRTEPHKWIDRIKPDTLILDELHRAKDEQGLTHEAIKSIRPKVKNAIGITASFVGNSPADVVGILNSIVPEEEPGWLFPRRREDFNEKFLDRGQDGTIKIKNLGELSPLLKKYVDYYGPGSPGFGQGEAAAPRKDVEEVAVEMSPRQEELMRYVFDQLPWLVRWKLEHSVEGLSDKEIQHVFSKIMAARQVSNSIHTLDSNITPEQSAQASPKVKKLLDDVEDHLKENPDGQAVLISRLVRGGADVLSAGLRSRGIEHGLFLGAGRLGQTAEDAQRAVTDYNARKIKALVLSPAGKEGLNLPDTTGVFVLDGHFNPEDINQMEARGIRAGGQSQRPPDQRHVTVKRYMAVPPGGLGRMLSNLFKRMVPFGLAGNPENTRSVDKWIYDAAHAKEQANAAIRGALAKTGEQGRLAWSVRWGGHAVSFFQSKELAEKFIRTAGEHWGDKDMEETPQQRRMEPGAPVPSHDGVYHCDGWDGKCKHPDHKEEKMAHVLPDNYLKLSDSMAVTLKMKGPEFNAGFKALQSILSSTMPGIKFHEKEPHITLALAKRMKPEDIEAALPRLQDAVSQMSLSPHIGNIDSFKGPRNHVLHLESHDPSLDDAHETLKSILEEHGGKSDYPIYHPHLTIARRDDAPRPEELSRANRRLMSTSAPTLKPDGLQIEISAKKDGEREWQKLNAEVKLGYPISTVKEEFWRRFGGRLNRDLNKGGRPSHEEKHFLALLHHGARGDLDMPGDLLDLLSRLLPPQFIQYLSSKKEEIGEILDKLTEQERGLIGRMSPQEALQHARGKVKTAGSGMDDLVQQAQGAKGIPERKGLMDEAYTRWGQGERPSSTAKVNLGAGQFGSADLILPDKSLQMPAHVQKTFEYQQGGYPKDFLERVNTQQAGTFAEFGGKTWTDQKGGAKIYLPKLYGAQAGDIPGLAKPGLKAIQTEFLPGQYLDANDLPTGIGPLGNSAANAGSSVIPEELGGDMTWRDFKRNNATTMPGKRIGFFDVQAPDWYGAEGQPSTRLPSPSSSWTVSGARDNVFNRLMQSGIGRFGGKLLQATPGLQVLPFMREAVKDFRSGNQRSLEDFIPAVFGLPTQQQVRETTTDA